MEICLMIEGQEGVTWDQWVSLALACEEQGLHGLFRSDHYQSFSHPAEWGSLDAWATLSALAASTERIRLGTMVSPVTYRHPAELAKVVTTVDHASAGRVELGMGAGWFEAEHRAYGFPFPSTRERMDILAEQLEIVHRMWDRDEPEVSFKGRHYEVVAGHALPKPLQDPHPPLIVGGEGGARSAQLAALWADEYNLGFLDPAGIPERRDRILAACEAIERDPSSMRLSLAANLIIGTDQADLEARASRLMERRGQSGDPAAWLDSLGRERIIGAPDQVLAHLRVLSETGVDRVLFQHLSHEDVEVVEIIGQEILLEAADL